MKTLRVSICLLLIVGVLAMSLSVFAVEETTPTATPYPGTEDNPLMQNNFDDIAFIIWQLLDSWGIKVTYGNITQYTSDIENQIQNWVWEFLDEQPSVETVASWVLDWWFGTDIWGNLVTNDTLLEDVEAFADWLVEKYNLTDNQQIVIEPIYTLGGYTVYDMYTWYSSDFTITNPNEVLYVGVTANENGSSVTNLPHYIIVENITTGETGYLFFFLNQNSAWPSVQIRGLTTTGGSNQITATGNLRPTLTKNVYWCLVIPSTYGLSGQAVPFGNYAPVTSVDSNGVINFWNQNDNWSIQQEGDLKFLTGDIVLPQDASGYTSGDGVTIVDGTPNYGEIVIPDSITVDNLPAVITQRTIPDIGNDSENPGFSVPWQAINGLIQYVAAPAGALMSLVNEAPVEGVIMLYALIGGMIIFGMIRIMREH